MRAPGLVLIAVVAGACGGKAAPPPEEPTAEFRGGGARAEKIQAKLLRGWQQGLPRGFELTLVVDVDAGAADAERLLAMGAHEVRSVSVKERGPYGVAAAQAEEGVPATSWLVHAPVEILLYLAELPWVTGVALATSWPGGAELPAEVERRLDPTLRSALDTWGAERPFAIGGLGEAQGCLDDVRRGELAALGAVVSTVLPAQDCDHSIFTFEIPLGSLVALASLPWIVQLEGSRPMYLEAR